jgi:antitoxin MazE
MNMMIHSKVVKIGNSRGIRIPCVVLEQVGLTDKVDMKVEGNRLIIQAAHYQRQDWETRFAEMAQQGDDRLMDQISTTGWDENEWTW